MRQHLSRCQVTALVLGATVALFLGACSSKNSAETVGHGLPDTSSSRAARPPAAARCELDLEIDSPDSDTPEWVVSELFSAALMEGDDEKAFSRFAGLFASHHRKEWVREAYWAGAKKHVSAYVDEDADEDEVAFRVCRRVEESPKRLKLFIGSHDASRSHMPITLSLDDTGSWKVATYTP